MTLTKAVSGRLALPAGLALCLIATAAFAQAFSREQDIAEVNRLGVSGYFVKSNLSLQALGELVGRVLDGQSP